MDQTDEWHLGATHGVALCAGAGRRDRRVLRGGSFNNNRESARCAVRNRNNPNNDWNENGFRVVVSHVFPVLAGNVLRPRLALSTAEGLGDRGFERWPTESLAEPCAT
jgi:hypothetical protein